MGQRLTERGLRLKHPAARVLSTRGHLDALGHRVRRDGLLPKTVRRLTARVTRALDDPSIEPAQLAQQARSVAAWSLFG